MYVSTDHLLATALPLVYLADCVRLLGQQEAIVIVSGGRIRAIEAGSNFLLARRRPVLLNPLLPSRVGLRAHWSGEGVSASDAAQSTERLAAALRPIGWTSSVAALFAAVAAPAALIAGRSNGFLVCWCVCVLSSLAGGVLAWHRRESLGVTGWSVAWSSLVAIVCMPLAGTFVRNLVAARRLRLALPTFALMYLQGPALASFRRSFTGALQAMRRQAEDGSAAALRLDDLIKQTEQ